MSLLQITEMFFNGPAGLVLAYITNGRKKIYFVVKILHGELQNPQLFLVPTFPVLQNMRFASQQCPFRGKI